MPQDLTPKEILAIWERSHFRLSDKLREVFLNRTEIEFIKTYDRSWVVAEIHSHRYLELVLRNLKYRAAPKEPDQHPSVALCGACGGSFDGIYSNCKCFG